jgi:hypothetical protein
MDCDQVLWFNDTTHRHLPLIGISLLPSVPPPSPRRQRAKIASPNYVHLRHDSPTLVFVSRETLEARGVLGYRGLLHDKIHRP